MTTGRAAALGRKPKPEDPRVAAARAKEPELGAAGRLCLEAWQTLGSTRIPFAVPIGLGGSVITSGSIPFGAIKKWCKHKGLGRSETDIVAFVLGRLDADRGKRETTRLRDAARQASGKR